MESSDTPTVGPESYEDAPTPQPTEPARTATRAPEPVTPPVDPEPDSGEGRKVYMPRILVDEFGMSESTAREVLMMGDLFINEPRSKDDGERVDSQHEKLEMPYEKIAGKQVTFKSDIRSGRFVYGG